MVCTYHYKFVKRLLLLILIVFYAYNLTAQRDYYYRDSTIYSTNGSLSYVAGKRHLYKWNQNSLELIKDFTVLGDSTFYIRDVDFIDSNTGFVVVGSIYIGGESKLYFTQNAGKNWSLDTSYYAASLHKSINQMQVLKDGTLVLFDGYYESAVLRSTDGGKSWKLWLNSLIAHYFQLFECDNGVWYLIGLPGDGFSSYSFKVDDTLWNKSDIKSYYNGCVAFGNACVRVLRDGERDRETDFIRKQQDTLAKRCMMKVELLKISHKNQIHIFPNPATDEWTVKINSSLELQGCNLQIQDFAGRQLFQTSITQSEIQLVKSEKLNTGSYIVGVRDKQGMLLCSQILVVR